MAAVTSYTPVSLSRALTALDTALGSNSIDLAEAQRRYSILSSASQTISLPQDVSALGMRIYNRLYTDPALSISSSLLALDTALELNCIDPREAERRYAILSNATQTLTLSADVLAIGMRVYNRIINHRPWLVQIKAVLAQ